jgi:glycosyltransferase involved in cell wall biosynthesis
MNSKRKIAFSARGLIGHPTGPTSYIEGFVGEFLKQATDYETHLYYNNALALGRFPNAIEHNIPSKNIFLWDHFLLPKQLKQDKIDFAFFLKDTIPIKLSCSSAVFMLDLGYFYPELNAYKTLNTFYMRPAIKYAAKHANIIFTISENTRQDVIRLLKSNPKNTINVYGAAASIYKPVTDLNILEKIKQKYNLVEPFIFFPTSVSPRKNFSRLLDAFEKVKASLPHHLYFTGGLSWKSGEINNRLLGPISEYVHKLGTVPIEDMPALYSLAQFTVYPSLFEGLGLPVLEAFQCGSPLLTSNLTSIPEIAGDAALMVDGYSTQEIAQGILQLASNDVLRNTLRNKGFQQAKKFIWPRTIKKVLAWLDQFFT